MTSLLLDDEEAAAMISLAASAEIVRFEPLCILLVRTCALQISDQTLYNNERKLKLTLGE